MKQTLAATVRFVVCLAYLGASIAVLQACGKYADGEASNNDHGAHSKVQPGQAELTGLGYVPAFLAAGYQTRNVSFEVKETLVDIGGGYSYRALTYDGSFPARPLVVEQGTLVHIRLSNKSSSEHIIHTHVVKYKPQNDGTASTAVPPGESRSFFWEVTDATPPGFYPFHDHGGQGEGALARGLVGILNVVKKGESAKAGYGILLHDLDPAFLFSRSGAPLPSGAMAGGHGGHGSGTAFSSSGKDASMPMHLINGRYGEADENRFSLRKGTKLRIGVVNLGANIHSFHPHGNSFQDEAGRTSDVLELQPGAFRTVELDGQAEGDWSYHCHVPGHPEGGMVSRYSVN
ncbi:MAG: multicopper oxidase domain-containing protein [Silvanigrellales bacterium]|nr:multicopper oxidase domain-containing protein [Silvanigrellales bacterium]